MSDVPPELISDIFSRLPVKSLLRFRSLSKPVCALIDSAKFINSHLHNSLNSNSDTSIVTVDNNNLYFIDFDLFDNFNLLNFPDTQVVGCCNGLVCLLSKDGILLCNPSTKKLKKLPVSGIKFPGDRFCSNIFNFVKLGFGYDFVNEDYKVVQIAHFPGEVANDIRVYSLKSNLWRRIRDFPDYLMFEGYGSGVLVNGILHWVATLNPIRKDVKNSISEVDKAIIGSPDECKIISFDLATEEYRLVPHPQHSIKNFWMNIGELGGRLCVHCDEWMRYTDIWAMNCYGVEDSWTKLLSVTKSVDILPYESPRVVAYSKDEKEVLLELDNGQLLWYDLILKTVKHIRIPGIPKFSCPYICHRSLVKLTGGARTDVTLEESEIRKRDDFVSKGFELKL